MELERTKEMDELCKYLIQMVKEKSWHEQKAQQCLVSVMIFGVIGIFFLPSLVIAVLCYCLHRWGLAKVKQATKEIERIDAVPGIADYFRQFYYVPQSDS